MVNFVTPTRLPDSSAQIYTSIFPYPKPYPWNPNIGGNQNQFGQSEGNASILNNLWQIGATADYHGYYYMVQSNGFVRADFIITDAITSTGRFDVVYNPTRRKIIAGFYKRTGSNITAQVFESVNAFDLTSGDLGTISMVQVFNGTFNGVLSTLVTPDLITLLCLPGGGTNSWGVTFYYESGANGWITSYYDPIGAQLYCLVSSAGTGTRLPPITTQCAIQNLGGQYRAIAYVSGVGEQILAIITFGLASSETPGTSTYFYVNGFTLGDYFQFSKQHYFTMSDGYFYALDTSVPFSMYKIAPDGTTYQMVQLIGGDQAAQNFVNNATANFFWGYSQQANTPIFTTGLVDNPLYFVYAPVIPRLIMGPGPIIPALPLACQNFCLPMFRMKKI